MKEIYKKFQQLLFEPRLNEISDEYSFFSKDLDASQIKLGISIDSLPVLMIPSSEEGEAKPTTKYSGLEVMLNRKCKLIDGKSDSRAFHLIKCLDNETKIIKTFLDFFEDLFSEPNGQDIDYILERLGSLSKLLELRKKSRENAMGLWSELFLINSYSMVNEFIIAWHNEVREKLDFEFSETAIEVKSFSGDQRVHHFSQNQLSNLSYENLFIMSVQLKEIDETVSIRDLYLQILGNITERETKDKFNNVFYEYAGNMDLDDHRFSIPIANNTVRFFRASDVPSINDVDIPMEVSALRYKSDCSRVEPVEFEEISELI